jgi:hypothetical protein
MALPKRALAKLSVMIVHVFTMRPPFSTDKESFEKENRNLRDD